MVQRTPVSMVNHTAHMPNDGASARAFTYTYNSAPPRNPNPRSSRNIRSSVLALKGKLYVLNMCTYDVRTNKNLWT